MIYEWVAPAVSGIVSPFAFLPSATLGMVIWVLFTLVAIAYAVEIAKPSSRWPQKIAGVPVPMLLATLIYAGLFLNLYTLVDEVSINLEHPYNLFHFGKFSMSSTSWVDGTVEMIYYLLHAPFGRSQEGLIAANFGISFLVGWLHLPLAGKLLNRQATTARQTVHLCGFALCAPLLIVFSSGFGNGLVSLVFLAAMVAAEEEKIALSLVLSGLLPLLRPDAILLAVIHPAVLVFRRRLQRSHYALLAIPAFSMAIYYACYHALYGHWIPTPIRFKSLTPAMIQMTSIGSFVLTLGLYLIQPFHAIGVAILVAAIKRWRSNGQQNSLVIYTVATLPLLFFYMFTKSTIGDFSFHTYARYWVAFEVPFVLLTLRALAERGTKGYALAMLIIGATLIQGIAFRDGTRGREDSTFAGAFTQRFLPEELTLSTSEMDTFGLMIDRPVMDLWGYTTPEIAFSRTCNQDHIRNNPEVFLRARPDIYWPYWFTPGLGTEEETGRYESAEASLAEFHHTSHVGNLLGDMHRVLAEYDLVIIEFPDRPKQNQIAYLVRKDSRQKLFDHLAAEGIKPSRQRVLDQEKFDSIYDKKPMVTHNCG